MRDLLKFALLCAVSFMVPFVLETGDIRYGAIMLLFTGWLVLFYEICIVFPVLHHVRRSRDTMTRRVLVLVVMVGLPGLWPISKTLDANLVGDTVLWFTINKDNQETGRLILFIWQFGLWIVLSALVGALMGPWRRSRDEA